MAKMSKAPTDAEMTQRYSESEAQRARAARVQVMISVLTTRGRSLAQARRTQLATVVIAMGLNAAPMSRAAMLAAIEGRA
jgi:hypothetical protein